MDTQYSAKRGSELLTEDEIRAHIAALIRLENVGILLGSGASKGVGGKTISDIWLEFKNGYKESYELLDKYKFINETSMNIEDLLDALEIALVEWERQNKKKIVKKLKNAICDLKRAIIKSTILESTYWNKPEQLADCSKKLQSHCTLLQRLTSARQPGQSSPWVFTTNYDISVELAAENIKLKVINGFEGLHNRTFSPHSFDLGYRNMLAKGEARFGTYCIYLAKLHGSLTWTTYDDEYIELPALAMWKKIDDFINARNKSLACPVVFPSGAKYIQTVGFVLGELIRRFVEFLSKPQTCLFVNGYSFADKHINQIITRAMNNPTLQIVVCVPDAKIENNELKLTINNKWLEKLANFQSPQITIITGPNNAFFENFVKLLPDPVIYDEQAQKIKKLLSDMKEEGKKDA